MQEGEKEGATQWVPGLDIQGEGGRQVLRVEKGSEGAFDQAENL